MDLSATIRQLYAEKEKVARAITAMEELQRADDAAGDAASASASEPPRSVRRRGRTSMDKEERQRVSERMKSYWAARRGQVRPPRKAGQQSELSESQKAEPPPGEYAAGST